MSELSTKDKIFYAAIDLYSQRGFNNVSIRELARAVGIKESSVYNHYPSKQAILDGIIDYFIQRTSETPSIDEAAGYIAGCDMPAFIALSIGAFKHYINDPIARKIWKILAIEKYTNPVINNLFKKVLIDEAIEYQAQVFEKLQAQGLMKKDVDPKVLATEFHAFNVYLYYRYVELEDPEDEQIIKTAEELLVNHLKFFRQ